jgi:nucleoid DNA-binding protein
VVVREALVRGETIEVPGLGRFHVHHQPSQIEEQADGQVLMIPPRDEVAFVPEP